MKITFAAVTLAALGFFVGSIAACKSDDDHGHDAAGGHSSPYAACNAIIQACHPYDTEDGPIHDCHDLAHDATSEAPCLPRKDDCIKLCNAAAVDSGTTKSDAGDGGAK